MLIGACVFAAVVLGTSFPVSELLSQHAQLTSTERDLGGIEAQNSALGQEAKQLANPSTVANIARRDYGLVPPGSQAYEVLPAPGSAAGSGQSSGHVPLQGPPVMPGSEQSQQILSAGTGPGTGSTSNGTGGPASRGSASGATTQAGSTTGAVSSHKGSSASAGPGTSGGAGGFWTRVVHTLEFWR